MHELGDRYRHRSDRDVEAVSFRPGSAEDQPGPRDQRAHLPILSANVVTAAGRIAIAELRRNPVKLLLQVAAREYSQAKRTVKLLALLAANL